MRWLNELIWPAETRHASTTFVRDGSLLAAAEMLRGGITTCNDMCFYRRPRAFSRLGLAGRAPDHRHRVPVAIRLRRRGISDAGRSRHLRRRGRPVHSASPCPAPTVADRTLSASRANWPRNELPIHVHHHETLEINDSLRDFGQRPISRLDPQFGPSAPTSSRAMLCISTTDIERLPPRLRHRPLPLQYEARQRRRPGRPAARQGPNVGSGTDGAASNNRLDLFPRMQ